MHHYNVENGARNLLVNCAGLVKGDKVVILHEDPALGWYDLEAPIAVDTMASQMGIHSRLLKVGGPRNKPIAELTKIHKNYDNIICFARIGDQNRFSPQAPNKRFIMCYVRDVNMLASCYGCADHRAFKQLKESINSILLNATEIKINCPLGTNINGKISKRFRQKNKDVSVLRFPMAVPQPIIASDFSGQVALSGYLTSTGCKVYSPAVLKIDQPVFAQIESGKIKSFEGDPVLVSSIQNHYDSVARKFDIDAYIVHSWHAGIHPGCSYDYDATISPDHWSNTIFGNPRILHFHTCGNYAPGEISWNVLDPSISVDGHKLWDNGRLNLPDVEPAAQCLDAWPILTALIANPCDQIGLSG